MDLLKLKAAAWRLNTINRVTQEWRDQGGKFGADSIDWEIVERLYDLQFNCNNSMSVIEVRGNTAVFGAMEGQEYISYTWNLFRGIEKSSQLF